MSHDAEFDAQVRWLVDIEQIKQLNARACDDDYDQDTIAGLFTEDAIWDGGFMGCAKTREGIREFFANASNLVAFAVHGVSNPLIEVGGDSATGCMIAGEGIVAAIGVERDTLVRSTGKRYSMPFVHIIRFNGDNRIVHVREYNDTREMLEAFGGGQ